MCYLAWDTETTGLPMTRQTATPENVHLFDMCRIVSLAFVTYSTKGRELGSYHAVVYPDTFAVTATEIHGITHEHAVAHGRPFADVYADLVKASKDCILVAHNSPFDQNALMSECYRRGLSVEPFAATQFVCTLDMVRRWYLKPMKLVEIYRTLTGRELENAHNALADARACGEVYPLLRDMRRTFRPLGIPTVILRASDIASMVGKNAFKKPDEVMTNLWCKYSPETFRGRTKEQLALEAIARSTVAGDILDDARRFVSQNSSSVEQKARAAANQLVARSGLEGPALKAAGEYIRKTLYVNHGTRHEETTAERDPTFRTDDTFYHHDVCTIEGTLYQIVGRIDRLVANADGSLTIVEIKNRANKLFRTVRDYEEVQCQTYMEMLNIDSCRLVEQHDDQVFTHLIRRQKETWAGDILPKLKNFCECFHSLLSI